MKYLPLRDFDEITNALNFDTADCHVLGGCDVYTTKAAGADKKLYRNIEKSLESQYASVLTFSASLTAQQAKAAGPSLNLSRASPFGSLSQISSRRTFAYLIATLNASHPDYDFSYLLRPSDFKREKSLKKVINTLDTTLYNLRPQSLSLGASSGKQFRSWSPSNGALDDSASSPSSSTPGSERWNPRMWHLIDQEMSLKECSIYAYTPEEDPYDGEEGALWSFNYFFFNKNKKRVCYLYLRGVSNIEIASMNNGGLKTPLSAIYSGAATPRARSKRCASGTWSISSAETGKKRARYWLGDRASDAELVDDDDDEGDVQSHATDAEEEEEEEDQGVGERNGAENQNVTSSKLVGRNKKAPIQMATEANKEQEEEERHFAALSSTDEAGPGSGSGSGTGSESPCEGLPKSKSRSKARPRTMIVSGKSAI